MSSRRINYLEGELRHARLWQADARQQVKTSTSLVLKLMVQLEEEKLKETASG